MTLNGVPSGRLTVAGNAGRREGDGELLVDSQQKRISCSE